MRPPYYTVECDEQRDLFLGYLNRYRASGSDTDRQAMCNARRLFKKTARKCRLDYDQTRTSGFLQARCQNAKLYWRLLRGKAQPRVPPHIDNKTVYEHFQSIYMPQYDVDDVGEDIDRLLNEELHIIYD